MFVIINAICIKYNTQIQKCKDQEKEWVDSFAQLPFYLLTEGNLSKGMVFPEGEGMTATGDCFGDRKKADAPSVNVISGQEVSSRIRDLAAEI